MKISVAQLGARMHYAVPRIFAEAGHLENLFTDLCANKGLGAVIAGLPQSWLPTGARKLSARRAQGVPCERIVSFDRLGLSYWRRLRQARTRREQAQAHLWVGEEFARLILKKGLADAEMIYTFNSAGLKLLEFARARDIRTLHEQTIVPVPVQMRLLLEEHARWPDWEPATSSEDFFLPFLENEKAEWALADRILCGSQFVMDGLREAGGPVERAVAVPYGVDLPVQNSEVRSQKSDLRPPISGVHPLRVLTVGTVCLRKGAPYVAEAARKFAGQMEFRWAGSIDLTESGRKRLAQSVQLLGIVPRNEMAEQYQWADIFLLPSICEGSATAAYEAMAWGLPVVTTPNTGSPVEDGEHGLVTPIRDSAAICGALEQLAAPELRKKMGESARRHSKTFSVEAYGRRLLHATHFA